MACTSLCAAPPTQDGCQLVPCGDGGLQRAHQLLRQRLPRRARHAGIDQHPLAVLPCQEDRDGDGEQPRDGLPPLREPAPNEGGEGECSTAAAAGSSGGRGAGPAASSSGLPVQSISHLLKPGRWPGRLEHQDGDTRGEQSHQRGAEPHDVALGIQGPSPRADRPQFLARAAAAVVFLTHPGGAPKDTIGSQVTIGSHASALCACARPASRPEATAATPPCTPSSSSRWSAAEIIAMHSTVKR